MIKRMVWASLTAALVVGICAAAPADKVKVGDKAPEFALKDLADKEVALKDLKGKVVFLDFWATWCPPCKKALPHTQELSARKDAKGDDAKLVVLALDLREDKAKVEKFLTDNKYDFHTLLDAKGAAAEAYGVKGIPTFVVINKDGTVAWIGVGFGPNTAKDMDKAIDDAIAK